MESYESLLAHTAFGLVGAFGTAGNDFLGGSLLSQAALDDNTDLIALSSTLKSSCFKGSFTSNLDRIERIEEEAFSTNRNFNQADAFSNNFPNLLLLTQSADSTPLLLNNASSSTTFISGIGKDFLTGSSENSPLVGSFSSDLLTGMLLENQTPEPLPDLNGKFDEVKMPETIAPGDQGQARLIVTNQGEQRAIGSLKINLFASTDTILDSNDQLLNSLERPTFNLSSSLSKTYTLDFTNPQSVAPGAYYLLADIDVENAIAQSNLISTRVSAKGTDVILDWNATLLNAVATDKTAPPLAARNMAIVHTGIYTAVSVIDQLSSDYIDAVAPEGVSRRSAVAAVAHRLLSNLYSAQTAIFDVQLGLSLAEVPDGQAENYGVALGQFFADLILAWRSTDGSSNVVSYTPGTEPGDWQPTPPGFLPALLPQWSNVTPFAITSGSQFRPDGPPALDSADYAEEFNQVKELGSLNSTTRTAEQTEIAQFWADGLGTFTPPGHWNQIAESVSLAQGNTLSENARLFALLNIAEADAGIVAWDAKYEYNFWRPITAIRQADTDGNPDTLTDPTWNPLLVTPPFPEYISGHSTFSGAADAVLTSFFGDISFTNSSAGLPGVIRSFDSFTQAADEAGISRIYGGIHFQSANEDGLAAGRALGNYVTKIFPA